MVIFVSRGVLESVPYCLPQINIYSFKFSAFYSDPCGGSPLHPLILFPLGSQSFSLSYNYFQILANLRINEYQHKYIDSFWKELGTLP